MRATDRPEGPEDIARISRARLTRLRLQGLLPSPAELGALHRYPGNALLAHRLRSEGYTQLSTRRARTLIELARRVECRGVPGAIVDCGVWNGGSTILLGKGAPTREIWAFDSFEGMPKPGPGDPDAHPDWEGEVRGSEEMLREGFARLGGGVDRLKVVKGWFDDTLEEAANGIDRIAVLHVDADWYDSVRLPLEAFYGKVSPGGYVAVDDLRMWQGARQATNEFRARVGELAPIRAAYYWQKRGYGHRPTESAPVAAGSAPRHDKRGTPIASA